MFSPTKINCTYITYTHYWVHIGCDKLSYSIISLTINSKSMASHIMFPKIPSASETIKHNFLCPFHCVSKPDTSCSYNIWRWPDVRICIRDTVTNILFPLTVEYNVPNCVTITRVFYWMNVSVLYCVVPTLLCSSMFYKFICCDRILFLSSLSSFMIL